jgi:hypothetical protein
MLNLSKYTSGFLIKFWPELPGIYQVLYRFNHLKLISILSQSNMSQLMRPGTGSHNDRNFSTANPASLRNQVPRTAPASRVNLPFDPRQHQQYTQHQLQQIQQQRQQKIEQQHMQRPLTVADECRPSDSNYTSQPLRYQLPDMNLTVPIIRDAQGLHTQHPVCGR